MAGVLTLVKHDQAVKVLAAPLHQLLEAGEAAICQAARGLQAVESISGSNPLHHGQESTHTGSSCGRCLQRHINPDSQPTSTVFSWPSHQPPCRRTRGGDEGGVGEEDDALLHPNPVPRQLAVRQLVERMQRQVGGCGAGSREARGQWHYNLKLPVKVRGGCAAFPCNISTSWSPSPSPSRRCTSP
jgi:hypothetical protein